MTRGDAGLAVVHRYEALAPALEGRTVVDLWCGAGEGTAVLRRAGAEARGVDADAAAVEAGTFTWPQAPLVIDDPLRVLRRLEPGDVGAVVALQPERRSAAGDDVLDELVRLAHGGVAIAVVFAGNATGGLLAGARAGRAYARRLPDAQMFAQAAAEGSLIRALDGGADVYEARLASGSDDAPEDADAVLVVVGLEVSDVASLAVRPFPVAERARLEAALDDLRAVNARLGREWLGRGDAAAAAHVAGDALRLREAEQEIERLRAELRALHVSRGG